MNLSPGRGERVLGALDRRSKRYEPVGAKRPASAHKRAVAAEAYFATIFGSPPTFDGALASPTCQASGPRTAVASKSPSLLLAEPRGVMLAPTVYNKHQQEGGAGPWFCM